MKQESVLTIRIGNLKIKIVLRNGLCNLEHKTAAQMHSHTSFEIHTVLQGTAVLETEEKKVTLHTGDAILVCPNAFHKFLQQEKGTMISSFTFFISAYSQKNSPDYKELILKTLDKIKDVLIVKQNPFIADCIKNIIILLHSEKAFKDEAVKSLFTFFFTEIFAPLVSNNAPELYIEPEEAEQDTRIVMIEHYFSDHFAENICIRELSELLYLSEQQTGRIIQKVFGCGFREHLCKIRLSNAKRLLRDTNTDLYTIAEMVGYQSYNGFYLAFKKETGYTPLKYRQTYKSNTNEEV